MIINNLIKVVPKYLNIIITTSVQNHILTANYLLSAGDLYHVKRSLSFPIYRTLSHLIQYSVKCNSGTLKTLIYGILQMDSMTLILYIKIRNDYFVKMKWICNLY